MSKLTTALVDFGLKCINNELGEDLDKLRDDTEQEIKMILRQAAEQAFIKSHSAGDMFTAINQELENL